MKTLRAKRVKDFGFIDSCMKGMNELQAILPESTTEVPQSSRTSHSRIGREPKFSGE